VHPLIGTLPSLSLASLRIYPAQVAVPRRAVQCIFLREIASRQSPVRRIAPCCFQCSFGYAAHLDFAREIFVYCPIDR
jgi:hypothetical protein